MKAILFSLGTRGDIEPFLAIAERLNKNGHEVICAFPIQFRNLVDEAQFKFYGLSEKFLELIEGEKAKIVLGGKGDLFQKMGALLWMIKTSQSMQKEALLQQHDIVDLEQPDFIVYNQKCLYPVVWGLKHKGRTTMLSPLPCTIHETKEHASLGMGSDLGSFLNKLTYRFSNFFLFLTMKNATKKFQKELGLKVGVSGIKRHILKKEKMIYTISPNLFSKPSNWNDNVHVVGYHERNRDLHWKPTEQMKAFIEKNKRIVFITFGSMTNPTPEQRTSDIISVLSKHRISAVINTASGGLMQPETYPDHIFFTDNIPYEWILPKMYAVIHHGGSGTIHASIKCGCASMIIPHILDQHVWNDILPELNVGPRGMPIKKFSAKRFEKGLLELLYTEKYKDNAVRIGAEMNKENNEDYLLKVILEQ